MEGFLIFWILIALMAGWSGYNRTIGFWMAFLLSFFGGPIGWLVTLFSRRVYLTQGYKGQQPVMVQHYAVSPAQQEVKKNETNELDALKKEKLAALLDEWADGKITEEEYRIKKERVMLL